MHTQPAQLKRNFLSSKAPVIAESAPFDEIVKTFLAHQEPFYYVVNKNNELLGGVSIHAIKNVLHEEGLKNLVIARDLADSQIKGVSPRHTLADCMAQFALVDYEHLPVIQGNGSLKLLGCITRQDIIDLYNREILRKDVLGLKFVQDMGETKRKRDFIELPQEYKVDYLAVPHSFVGKTLKELAVRSKYDVSVIAIKKKMGDITSVSEVPSPDRILEAGDVLVVVGKESDVENLIKEAIKAKPAGTQ